MCRATDSLEEISKLIRGLCVLKRDCRKRVTCQLIPRILYFLFVVFVYCFVVSFLFWLPLFLFDFVFICYCLSSGARVWRVQAKSDDYTQRLKPPHPHSHCPTPIAPFHLQPPRTQTSIDVQNIVSICLYMSMGSKLIYPPPPLPPTPSISLQHASSPPTMSFQPNQVRLRMDEYRLHDQSPVNILLPKSAIACALFAGIK